MKTIILILSLTLCILIAGHEHRTRKVHHIGSYAHMGKYHVLIVGIDKEAR